MSAPRPKATSTEALLGDSRAAERLRGTRRLWRERPADLADRLVASLQDRARSVRYGAADLLGRLGSEAVPALLAHVTAAGSKPEGVIALVRTPAGRAALAALPDQGLALLQAALTLPDLREWHTVSLVAALAQCRGQRADKLLQALCSGKRVAARRPAARALAARAAQRIESEAKERRERAHAQALQVLEGFERRPLWEITPDMVEVIAALPDPRVEPLLRELAGWRSIVAGTAVRDAALAALDRIAVVESDRAATRLAEATPAEMADWLACHEQHRSNQVASAPEQAVLADVRTLLRSADTEARAAGLECWHTSQPDELADRLVACLSDPDGGVRSQAADWLQQHSELAVPALLREIHDRADCRHAVAMMVALPAGRQALEALDDHAHGLIEAALGLADLPDRQTADLAELLGRCGDLRALPRLAELAANPSEQVRAAAHQGLALLLRPSDANGRERRRGVRDFTVEMVGALAKLDDPRVVPTLKRLAGWRGALGQAGVRTAAQAALAHLFTSGAAVPDEALSPAANPATAGPAGLSRVRSGNGAEDEA